MGYRRGVPLGERPVETGAAPVPAPPNAAARRPPVRRHCWVRGVAGAPGPHPGLLVEWRRGAAGWEALVVYAVDDHGAVTLVQQWLASSLVTAAGSSWSGPGDAGRSA
jgi:hypothetical protein